LHEERIVKTLHLPSASSIVCACAAVLQGACAVGQTPRLPLVADAADKQISGSGPSGM
jgi:hypothetical protein